MKKRTIIVTCLSMLGLLAASCQKEQLPDPQSSIVAPDAVYQVSYLVNGVHYSIMLHGDDEMDLLLRQLNALARQGHRVEIVGNNTSTSTVAAKDVITFTTNSEEEILEWEKARIKEGYHVTIEYDPKTGIYTGTAIK